MYLSRTKQRCVQQFRRNVLQQKLFLISARVGGTLLDFLIVVKINSYKAEFLLLEKKRKNGSAVFVTFKLI